ncbi:hypothetical protein KIN20_004668 [Parelaphostrongylus tenuis]|uniref:Uncharacterized protein n=1 Tax=Parelaphostrongylus tenuis TaxID=148309 RepID=A0AAD5MRQ3_PARTN|nr:hypothetical protein KIN20_004668 [Parelaphostrongylus tenuis]
MTQCFAGSHQVSQPMSTPFSVLNSTPRHVAPPVNGFSEPKATYQINVTTNWNGLTSVSQGSSRTKADEWLEDVFRNSLSFSSPSPNSSVVDMSVQSSTHANMVHSCQMGSNYSISGGIATSGPPPVNPPPPLPTKEIVVNKSLNNRSGPVLDVFGQSVQWDVLPSTSVSEVEDPFDIQWSRLATGPFIGSNPFVTEGQQELRT